MTRTAAELTTPEGEAARLALRAAATAAAVRERVERGRCLGGGAANRCPSRPSSGYTGAAFCDAHDAEGRAYVGQLADRTEPCYRCSGRIPVGRTICDGCAEARDVNRRRHEAARAAAAPTLVVVNCTAAKADEPRPSGELYLGASYLFARTAADALAARTPGARVVILSALHGLLELDAVTAPYDVTFGDPAAIATDRLAAQLRNVGRIIALTPNRYTAALLEAADVADVPLVAPLVGCRGIGEQRGRLARIRDDRPSVDAPAEPAQLALFAA